MNMKKILIIFFLLFAIFQTNTVIAQDLLLGSDLSTLKVDNLSNAEVEKIKTQLKANNATIEQLEPMVLAKGMSAAEFAKLKVRLAAIGTPAMTNKQADRSPGEYNRAREVIVNTKIKDSLNSLVFGSELFDNPTLNFEPNLKLATPMNYILGPGDELQVSVYGVQEYNASIPVSVKGKASIQYVG